MRYRPVTALLLALLTALFVGQAAGAHPSHGSPDAVFVQTNELSGNRIVVYDRAKDGTLTQAGRYATGAPGGAARRRRGPRAIASPRRARSCTTASTVCCSR